VLPKDSFVEKNGLELKGKYVGHSAPQVQEAVADAMGGCLFIDEAYALAGDESGHNDSFSTEVIRTLLTEVENNRTNVLVILAGYKDKMARLLRADPGLPRRFPNQAHLSDYTPEELADIAETAAQDRFGLTFEPSLKEKLAVHITDHYISQIPKQNGGLAVNLTEEAMGRMAKRVITDGVVSGNATTTLTAADFAIAAETDSEEARRLIEEEIQALVGMAAGKAIFDDMRKRVLYVERGGNKKVLQVCLNMVITGNPGVGKTTLARLVSRFLHAYGVLPKDTFVEKNGLELKGQYVGQSCPRVVDAVADAMGGCLFIDEAYALASSHDTFSMEVIRTLLTEVENNRTNLLVILAGYKDKMQGLLNADPGLPRRFPNQVHLADYSPAELALIAETAARDRFGMNFEAGLVDKVAAMIKSKHQSSIRLHNGGLAVNLTEEALGRLADRCVQHNLYNEDTLTAFDFGIGNLQAPRRAAPSQKTSLIHPLQRPKGHGPRSPPRAPVTPTQENHSAIKQTAAGRYVAALRDKSLSKDELARLKAEMDAAMSTEPRAPIVPVVRRAPAAHDSEPKTRSPSTAAAAEDAAATAEDACICCQEEAPTAPDDALAVNPPAQPSNDEEEQRRWMAEVEMMTDSATEQVESDPDDWDAPAVAPPGSAPQNEAEQEEEETVGAIQSQEDTTTHTKKAPKEKKVNEKKVEQQRQEKIRRAGKCSEGYEWDRRQGNFTGPCLMCGGSPGDGYQCQGGSHWMCIKCIDKVKL